MVKKLKWNLVLMSLLYLGLGVFLVMKPGTALNIVCYAEGIMLVGFCIFQFAPRQVLGIFAASDAMLAIGVPAMRIICLHFLLAGVSIVLSSVFQALGNGVFSLIVSVCRQLFVLLPAAWLLAQTGSVNNVWWAFLIAEVVSILMSLAFYARINKTTIAPLYH